MKALNLNRWFRNHNTEENLMMTAADSLVHFTDSTSHTRKEIQDDDGLAAVEIARTAYLCMAV